MDEALKLRCEEAIKTMVSLLPPKVDYAELVCAEGFAHGFHYVWECPEHYAMDEAAKLIRELMDRIESGSDGYHTFDELYHHRAILFSVICNSRPDISWKSLHHSDGTMFDNMFIVGIETPDGQATYHYNIDPYWDLFCCKQIEQAPEWDGHTSEQALERIRMVKLT